MNNKQFLKLHADITKIIGTLKLKNIDLYIKLSINRDYDNIIDITVFNSNITNNFAQRVYLTDKYNKELIDKLNEFLKAIKSDNYRLAFTTSFIS
jgi:hypothetical protein